MLSPNGIRTILFDLDGTLRHSRPSFFHAFFDCAVRAGASDSPENRRASIRWLHYYWAQSPELVADQEKYEDQPEGFWTNHARLNLIAFGCSEEQAEALAPEVFSYMNDFEAEDWVAPEVPETLQTLKESGYQLGVLSNRTHSFAEQMAALELADYFEVLVAAGELNYWKPEPQVFHQTLEQLGAQAERTLYVGDNYYADVIGARRAGIFPVLIDPEGIFPEADCPVIESLNQLPDLLTQENLRQIPAE